MGSIDQRHELARLAKLIDWPAFARQWGGQLEFTTGRPALLKTVLADRGYRGVEPACGARPLISHIRRQPPRLKKQLKRRHVVEPMIGHMKANGLLDKNWRKGTEGMRCTPCCAAPGTTCA